MKEQVFRANRRRIAKQSFFIWLWVLIHILINIWLIPMPINDNKVLLFLLVNFVFGLFSIPGIIIFRRYHKHSINKKFVLTYNSLRLEDEKSLKFLEIKNHEIVEVKLITNNHASNLPWTFMEYFSLTDKNGSMIIVPSFIMEISEFWLSTLTRKVSNKNFIRKESIYPIFKSCH